MTWRIRAAAVEACKADRYADAKRILMHKCKTKPVELAYRLGKVIGALTDPDGSHKQPDRAVKLLELFDQDNQNE